MYTLLAGCQNTKVLPVGMLANHVNGFRVMSEVTSSYKSPAQSGSVSYRVDWLFTCKLLNEFLHYMYLDKSAGGCYDQQCVTKQVILDLIQT